MESLKDLLEAAREHGPVTAAWLLFVGSVAFFGGQSAKIVMGSMKGLLDSSAKLRDQMQDQVEKQTERVEELTAQLADANAQMRSVEVLLHKANEQAREARDAHLAAVARADALSQQYAELSREHTRLQGKMRDTLLALHIAKGAPAPKET